MTAQEVENPTPVVEIVAGNPSDEDVAAITAILAMVRRGRGRPHAPQKSVIAGGWKSYWHTVRHPFLPGRDAWRSTFRR